MGNKHLRLALDEYASQLVLGCIREESICSTCKMPSPDPVLIFRSYKEDCNVIADGKLDVLSKLNETAKSIENSLKYVEKELASSIYQEDIKLINEEKKQFENELLYYKNLIKKCEMISNIQYHLMLVEIVTERSSYFYKLFRGLIDSSKVIVLHQEMIP